MQIRVSHLSGREKSMKTRTTQHSRRPILGARKGWMLGAVCSAAFLPLAAQAACSQWDVSGGWSAVQSNDTKPAFILQQNGAQLQGSASYSYVHKSQCVLAYCGDDAYSVDGSVDGTIDGNAIDITAYWNNGTVGVYTGKINAQGRIEGSSYDRQHPQTMASWYSDRTIKCLTDENTQPPSSAPPAAKKPAVALGRVHAAPANAWSRMKANPLHADVRAPALAVLATPSRDMPARPPALPPGKQGPPPDQVPPPEPAQAAAPVIAPNDLIIGRMRFSQNAEPVQDVALGIPVAIDCDYSVNASRGPFAPHIRPWHGSVQIGGAAPENLEFEGSTEAGQHVARVTWTPTVAGQTPIACTINPQFADAEAVPGNNRWDQILLVVPKDAPPDNGQ